MDSTEASHTPYYQATSVTVLQSAMVCSYPPQAGADSLPHCCDVLVPQIKPRGKGEGGDTNNGIAHCKLHKYKMWDGGNEPQIRTQH